MVAAVAVVAQAVLSMMRSLAPDPARATLAVAAAVMVLALPSSFGQIGAIALGGVIGFVALRGAPPADHVGLPHPVNRTAAIAAIVLFFAILIGLPLVAAQPRAAIIRCLLSRRLARVRRRARRAAVVTSCRRAAGLGQQ
jgi:chromate transporter